MPGSNRFCSANGFCFQAGRRSTSLGGDAARRGKAEAIGRQVNPLPTRIEQ